MQLAEPFAGSWIREYTRTGMKRIVQKIDAKNLGKTFDKSTAPFLLQQEATLGLSDGPDMLRITLPRITVVATKSVHVSGVPQRLAGAQVFVERHDNDATTVVLPTDFNEKFSPWSRREMDDAAYKWDQDCTISSWTGNSSGRASCTSALKSWTSWTHE